MKVSVWHTEGHVEFKHLPDGDAMDLLEQFEHGDAAALRFTLDETSITSIARRHVIRIDLDPEDPS